VPHEGFQIIALDDEIATLGVFSGFRPQAGAD
jgi:hypothetical protein